MPFSTNNIHCKSLNTISRYFTENIVSTVLFQIQELLDILNIQPVNEIFHYIESLNNTNDAFVAYFILPFFTDNIGYFNFKFKV